MKTKPELQNKYDNWVKINSKDGYGKACVIAIEDVARLLDEGKSPQEAEEGLCGQELTGFMAGVVASAIAHFHPRGDEFNVYWNKRNGGTGEETGTINPAIMTVETKENTNKKE